MLRKRVCVITDNKYIYEKFKEIKDKYPHDFVFYYSAHNNKFIDEYANDINFSPISLKSCDETFYQQFDLFISLHCKQLFPKILVDNHNCINVHPGFNPYNRGWFPQVFSIINGKPIGVTIHKMDEELDHGAIIAQKKLEIEPWETSLDIYRRILQAEIDLLNVHLKDILNDNYTAVPMKEEGNINYKADFDKLCYLDMEHKASLQEHIDLLRALTFDGYDNAFFIDAKGNKIYVSISLKKDSH